MAVQIISASGAQHGVIVNPDGSINVKLDGVVISGLDIGDVIIQETSPLDPSKNNPYKTLKYLTYSGTSLGVGSVIGSIVQYIGAGSFVKVLGYDSAYNVVNIGSWS